MQELGKILLILGLVLSLFGLVLYLSPHLSQLPFFRKLGHLPGDISVQKEHFHFYFPLGTSILLSLIVSLLLYLIRFWRR
jgi:hypothetical protein